MQRIPFPYIWRNLLKRRTTTLLTAGGMALVVFVFACVLMLTEGIRATLVATGQPDNVVVIRKGSGTETQSSVSRDQASIIESLSTIATGVDGGKLISKEPVVVINLPKRADGKPSNVTTRGITPQGLALRPQIQIIEGRMMRPGTSEIIVGRAIAARFRGAGMGESLRFAQRDWVVVGVFDGGKSGFDSEIWGDGEQLLQSFRRGAYSSLIFKLTDYDAFDATKSMIESDQRLTVEVKRETRFYAEQSEGLATFISILGTVLSVIFSIGAIVGAMITMYASVAARTAEIGTLRALGFQRTSILIAFLGESMLLGCVGGLMGLTAASLMHGVNLSTTNFQTFAEVAFSFTFTPRIGLNCMLFAVFMGFVGGFLPAAQAARLKIVDALRASG